MFGLNRIVPSLLATLLIPSLASAHPNHDLTMSLADGFMHPLTGIDHMLAMIAVGLWAAHLGKRATWMLPVAFPAAMLVGVGLDAAYVALPAIEPVIAISVLALGCLIALRVCIHDVLAATLVGGFAVFHGYAHASETVGSLSAPFAMGFVIATLLLHLIGIALAPPLVKRSVGHVRLAGSLIGATGAVLLFSL